MASRYDGEDRLRPQVQDRWGRSPGDPDYGRNPTGAPSQKFTGAMPPAEGEGDPTLTVPYGNDQRETELPPGGGSDWQHPSGAWHPDASIMAPRLMHQNGQWTLTEHGNQRPLQPDEVASAQGYVTDFWNQNPTGFIQPGSPGYAPGQAMSNAEYGQPRAPVSTVGGLTGPGPVGREPGLAGPGPNGYAPWTRREPTGPPSGLQLGNDGGGGFWTGTRFGFGGGGPAGNAAGGMASMFGGGGAARRPTIGGITGFGAAPGPVLGSGGLGGTDQPTLLR